MLTFLFGLLFLNSWGQDANTAQSQLGFDVDPVALMNAYESWQAKRALDTPKSWAVETNLVARSISPMIRSVQDGTWNDPNTWDCGCVPRLTNDVVIADEVTLTEGVEAQAFNLFIEATGSLIDDGQGVLQLRAGFAAGGSATIDESTLELDSLGGIHILTGAIEVDRLTVSNNSTTILTGSIEIHTHLELDEAIIDATGGELRLTQGQFGRATVRRTNGGEVRGEVTRVLQLPATPNSQFWLNYPLTYQIFSIGLEGVTLSELTDDFPTTGFVGSDDPSANPNIGYKDETVSGGGLAHFANATDTLPVWRAIQVNLPIQNEIEVEFSGTLPSASNTYDVTSSGAGNVGINWLGNANNSGMDIMQFSNQIGVNSAMKCWNTESLRWDLYIDGYSTNGMGGYVEPNEVCQIQFDADQSIPFVGDHEIRSYEKASIAQNESHSAKAVFGLRNASGFSDEAILTVKENASFGMEFDEDVLNHFGQLDACDLFVEHGGTKYGISQVGFEGKAILEATLRYSGFQPIDNLFTIEVSELELGDYCGFIQFEGETDVLPLENGLSRDFQLTNTTYYNGIHFATLYLVPPVRTEATSTACEGDEFAHIAVTPGGQGPWTYVMSNETGDSFEGVLSGNGVTTNFLDLPTGVYTGEVVTEDALACGSLTFTEEVLSPTTIDMVTTVAHDCGEGGEVTIESEGGKLPVSYEWSNATSGDVLTNAAAGIYEVIATDANGCKDTTSVEVMTAPTLTWTSQNTDCESQGPTAIAFESADDTTTWSVTVKNELGDVVDAALNATAPFELTDLGAGTFSIDMDIMPFYGCATSSDVVTLLEPVAINMEATTHIQCNDLILGDAEVAVDGGVGDVALVWEDGTEGNTINNLVAGTYAVTATDELGCSETLDVVVELAPGMNIEAVSPGCDGEGATELTINGEGETTWNFTVYAATGDVYAEFNETDGHAELANLPSGTYYVVGVNTELNGCPQQDASVSLVQATDLEVEYSVVPLGCDGEHRGEIALDIETTATPVQVAWDHGATEATLTDLGPGQYYATVIDAYGCAKEVRVALEEAPSVVADFEVPTAGLTDGTNGMTLTFTNTSEGATDYTWYFGDTDVPSFDVHATHTFAEPGAYDVFLNAWNDHCSHTVRQTVIVSQGEDTTGDDDLGLLATDVAEGDWTEISAPIQTSNGWVMDLGVVAEGTKMMAYDLTGRTLCAPASPDASGKIWVENDQWPAIVLLRLVHEPTNNIRTWKMLR